MSLRRWAIIILQKLVSKRKVILIFFYPAAVANGESIMFLLTSQFEFSRHFILYTIGHFVYISVWHKGVKYFLNQQSQKMSFKAVLFIKDTLKT